MNLQSLLASIESRFDEMWPMGLMPNVTGVNVAAQNENIKAFIKQSNEEIIQAVVEAIEADKKGWEELRDNPRANEAEVYEAEVHIAVFDDLKEALLSPKDT